MFLAHLDPTTWEIRNSVKNPHNGLLISPTLYVFGDLCVDIVALPRSMPRPGEEATLDRLDIVCGGAAFNCAVAAAKAGAPRVKLLGLVGEDEFGTTLVRQLQANGVDTSLVQTHSGRTGTVLSIASPDGDRTLYSYRGVNAEQYLSLPELNRGDYVYLSGYSLQEASSRLPALELKEQARVKGAICLLDPSFQSAAALADSDFLHGLDWITPNATEARLITGGSDPTLLRALGVANAVVTLGADGCAVATESMKTSIPAIPVSVAHTTGAGDAFCGGLLAALIDDRGPAEAALRGNRAAASAIAHNRSQ